MITMDYRPFREEVLEFLDSYPNSSTTGSREEVTRGMHEGIVRIIKKHAVPISPDQFANMVVKLTVAGNKSRAERLLMSLGDRGLTLFGTVLVFLLRLVFFKLLPLALFVVFIIWAWTKCSG